MGHAGWGAPLISILTQLIQRRKQLVGYRDRSRIGLEGPLIDDQADKFGGQVNVGLL